MFGLAKAMQMTPAEVRAMEFREMTIYSVLEREFQEEQEKLPLPLLWL